MHISGMSQTQRAVLVSLQEFDEHFLKLAQSVAPLLRKYGTVGLWHVADELNRITTETVCSGLEVAHVLDLMEAMKEGTVLSARTVQVSADHVNGETSEQEGWLLESRNGGLLLYVCEERILHRLMMKDELDKWGFTAEELAGHINFVALQLWEHEEPTVCLYHGDIVLFMCKTKEEFLELIAKEKALEHSDD